MNCQEVMELMQRHVDQDLNEQETSLMMDHVGQCPECAAMLDKLVRLSRGLEQMPRVEPPYNLVDAILPQLPLWDEGISAIPSEPGTAAPNSRRVNRPRRAWAARISGVVALGVIIAIFALNGPDLGRMGSSAQHEASKLSGSANSEDSSAFQLKSDTLLNDSKVKDQHGYEMPMADARSKAPEEFTSGQAPAAAPNSAPITDNRPSDEGSGSANVHESLDSAESMKGMGINQTEEATNPPMSMKETAPDVEEAISPDGKWKAVLTDGMLQLYRSNHDELVFESAAHSGIRNNLVWRDDSTALDYTYIDAEGKTTQRSLLVLEMKEIER